MKEKFDPIKRFNQRAAKYDSDIETIIPGYPNLQELSFFILKNKLPKNSRVLVAGTGTSNEAVLFAAENQGWKIVAFDNAGEMIKVSKRKISRKKLNKQITFVHGEITDVEEDNFDAATALLVMHFIKDKKSFLQNIYRRLKPGGIIILADICGNRKSGEFKEFLSYWKEFQVRKREDKEKIKETFMHIQNDLRIISTEKTITLLEETGFRNTGKFFTSLLINGFLAKKPRH